MSSLRLAATVFALVALTACEEAPLTAPTGSTIFLQGNPTFVIANGGISVVTAVVIEPAGTPAADGTEVFFFTNLGRIEEVGKTVRGIARVNFVSDSRSGQATITAISGAARGEPELVIGVGSTLPSLVLMTCNPARITTPRNCRLTATVFDEFGNPVQNVPVSFAITGSDLVVEERLDSGGAQLYTNSNGQVSDTLRTQAPIGLGQKTVTVSATTANNVTAEITVFVD